MFREQNIEIQHLIDQTQEQQLIQQKMITRDTLVWKQGMAQWSKAGSVPEMATMFAPQGPPPPPVPPT